MINEQLELVSDFMTLFGQPILNKEDEIPVERRKLRLALLFEELAELSNAYGVEKSFQKIVFTYLKENANVEDTGILNKKEVLDASCDLQYILSGTVLENGQQNEFDEAFEDVHKSNLSKLCKSTEEVEATEEKYAKENVETYNKALGGKYIGIFRKADNKILKSINYTPVDLSKYV